MKGRAEGEMLSARAKRLAACRENIAGAFASAGSTWQHAQMKARPGKFYETTPVLAKRSN
jgi:hypothetical protein